MTFFLYKQQTIFQRTQLPYATGLNSQILEIPSYFNIEGKIFAMNRGYDVFNTITNTVDHYIDLIDQTVLPNKE